MLKQIVLIHPIGQGLALFFGLFNIFSGLTRKFFVLPIHINCGVLYYCSALLGAGLGLFVTKWMQSKGMAVDMLIHEINAMALVLMMTMGATTGVLMLTARKRSSIVLKCHRFVNVAGLVFYLIQGMTGVAELGAFL